MAESNGKKKKIKEKARNLFFDFGYYKTNMEDIAREAGMAKPTLYYYYKSKEDIFNDVVLDEVNHTISMAKKNVPANETVEQKYRIFFHNIHELISKNAEEMKKRPEFFCEASPHGEPLIREMRNIIADTIKEFLTEGMEKGEFIIHDVDLTSQALTDIGAFMHMKWIVLHEKSYRVKIIDEILNIIMNGIKGGHK